MKPGKHWARQLRMAKAYLVSEPSNNEMVCFAQQVMAFDHPSQDADRVAKKMDIFLKEFGIKFEEIPLDGLPAADRLLFQMKPIENPDSKPKDITSMYFWNAATYLRIKQYLKPKKILEIGGGYGALARFFRKLDDTDYSIFDFQECSEFAKAYLSEAKVSDVKMINDEKELDQHYDLIISKGSIQEMPAEDRDFWMGYIRNHCDYYYSLNYSRTSPEFKETENVDALVVDYKEWETVYYKDNPEIIKMDTLDRDWFEIILKRIKHDNQW